MKNYAAVNHFGEPVFTVSPATDDDYQEGMVTPDGLIMREFPIDLSHAELLATRFWSQTGWKPRQGKPGEFFDWDLATESWVVNLSRLKVKKGQELSAACRQAIYAGFYSDALGAAHLYPCNDKDQQNLNGSVVDSLMTADPSWTTPFWCANEAGQWDFREHTAAQIQQVGRTAKYHILEMMRKNKGLQAQVAAATTVEEAESTTW